MFDKYTDRVPDWAGAVIFVLFMVLIMAATALIGEVVE